jgi:hypothetical protein
LATSNGIVGGNYRGFDGRIEFFIDPFTPLDVSENLVDRHSDEFTVDFLKIVAPFFEEQQSPVRSFRSLFILRR